MGSRGTFEYTKKKAKLFTIFFFLYSWIMHGLPSVNYYCKTTWFPTINQGKMRPWLLSLPQQTWLCLGVGLVCTLVRPRSKDPGEPGRELWLRPRSSRVLGGPGREPFHRPRSWQTVLPRPYPCHLVLKLVSGLIYLLVWSAYKPLSAWLLIYGLTATRNRIEYDWSLIKFTRFICL